MKCTCVPPHTHRSYHSDGGGVAYAWEIHIGEKNEEVNLPK